MQYRIKVRIAIVIATVLILDTMSYIAGFRESERREYEQTIQELRSALADDEMDAYTNERLYSQRLSDIVQMLYAGEGYRTGGYSTENGPSVDATYSAVMNAAYDFHSVLEETGNYFDAREKYLEEIPTTWPMRYDSVTRITSGFGMRVSPITGKLEWHGGLDITSVWRAEIISPADGVVVEYWPPPDGHFRGHPVYGGYIVIEHAGGFQTRYAHLSKSFVLDGSKIARGQVIGFMGNTGQSRGQHLHYEVWYKGVRVNPLDFLRF